jgi:hypothetical protein
LFLFGEGVKDIVHLFAGVEVIPDADPEAGIVVVAQEFRDIAETVMASMRAFALKAKLTER